MYKLAILGTGSSVGKTTIVTALCRHFANKNYNVAPFKGFNLSNNSFIKNSYTIGYAQYIQAIAAKTPYSVKMNPILKMFINNKPSLVVNGKKSFIPLNQQKILAYNAYNSLKRKFELVIVEGSGSMLELNLKNTDFANISFALKYNIPVILVADISKGGVFGNLYGHLKLLTSKEKSLVKGIIINRFSSNNIESFKDGIKIIEETCKLKVLGVIPEFNFTLPKEDEENNNKNVSLSDIEKNITKVTDNITKHLDIKFLEGIILNHN